jgi:hypothetical protein
MDPSMPKIVINAPVDNINSTPTNDTLRTNGTTINPHRHVPQRSRPGTLPAIDDNDSTEPRKLLRKYSIAATANKTYGFWSLALLRHILPRQRIINKLRQYSGNICGYIDHIRPAEDSKAGDETYLRVFALLLLQEKESEIKNFVRAHVCDEILPLRRFDDDEELDFKDPKDHHRPLKCFSGWKTSEKEWFLSNQWRVLIPFFKLDHEGRAENYDFEDETILPWLPWHKGNSTITSSQPSKGEGGYAEVFRTRIDPSSHDFQEVLQSVSL